MSVEPLAALDAAFLAMETPAMPLHLVAVAVVTPGPGGLGADRMRSLIADRLQQMPRLSSRVVHMPFGIDHPVWVEQPELDLAHHVRRASLPSPGGLDELTELVGELAGQRLDPDRPLWEMVVVEGLCSGDVALVAKVHHALFDGVSGFATLAALFDPSERAGQPGGVGQARGAGELCTGTDLSLGAGCGTSQRSAQTSDVAPGTEAGMGHGRATSSPELPDGSDARTSPTPLDLLGVAVRRWSQRPLALADVVAGTYLAARQMLGDPSSDDASGRVEPGSADGAARDRQAGVGGGENSEPMPFLVPRAPWNGTVSSRRVCAVARVPLDEVRVAGAIVGGTINDVVLAAVGGALRSFLLRGSSPELVDSMPSLVALAPISTRRTAGAGQGCGAGAGAGAGAAAGAAAGARGGGGEEPGGGDGMGRRADITGRGAGGRSAGRHGIQEGNQVSVMILELATEVTDPLVRLRLVAERSRQAKRRSAMVGEHLVSNWAEMAVPALATRAARLVSNVRAFDHVPPAANVLVSNMVGPPAALSCAGGQVQALYPFGPVADGIGLNISVVSYRSVLSIGLTACRDLMPDLRDLASDLTDNLAELTQRAADLRRGDQVIIADL